MDNALPFQLTVSGESESIVAAEKTLQAYLDDAGLLSIVASRAALVLEEVVLNACRHGGASEVSITVQLEERGCVIVFEDAGAPFDPLAGQFADPVPSHIDDVGGRGLLLIRRSTTRSRYDRLEGRNRLELEFRD